MIFSALETLKVKHTYEPANPDIAKVFFRAGYIETWGRGTVNIVEHCKKEGRPEPVFEGKWGGLLLKVGADKGGHWKIVGTDDG
ncbi:MAG: ATP-binding protein [bacterium]